MRLVNNKTGEILGSSEDERKRNSVVLVDNKTGNVLTGNGNKVGNMADLLPEPATQTELEDIPHAGFLDFAQNIAKKAFDYVAPSGIKNAVSAIDTLTGGKLKNYDYVQSARDAAAWRAEKENDPVWKRQQELKDQIKDATKERNAARRETRDPITWAAHKLASEAKDDTMRKEAEAYSHDAFANLDAANEKRSKLLDELHSIGGKYGINDLIGDIESMVFSPSGLSDIDVLGYNLGTKLGITDPNDAAIHNKEHALQKQRAQDIEAAQSGRGWLGQHIMQGLGAGGDMLSRAAVYQASGIPGALQTYATVPAQALSQTGIHNLDPTAAQKVTSAAGRLAGNALTDVVANPTNIAISFSSGLNKYDEAKTKGATDAQALAAGIGSAAAEYFSNKLFSGTPLVDNPNEMGYIVEDITDFTKWLAKKTGKEGIANGTEKFFANSIVSYVFDKSGEGFEEVITGVLEPWIERLTYDKEADLATLEDLWEEWLGGVFMSVVMDAGEPVSKFRANKARQRANNAIHAAFDAGRTGANLEETINNLKDVGVDEEDLRSVYQQGAEQLQSDAKNLSIETEGKSAKEIRAEVENRVNEINNLTPEEKETMTKRTSGLRTVALQTMGENGVRLVDSYLWKSKKTDSADYFNEAYEAYSMGRNGAKNTFQGKILDEEDAEKWYRAGVADAEMEENNGKQRQSVDGVEGRINGLDSEGQGPAVAAGADGQLTAEAAEGIGNGGQTDAAVSQRNEVNPETTDQNKTIDGVEGQVDAARPQRNEVSPETKDARSEIAEQKAAAEALAAGKEMTSSADQGIANGTKFKTFRKLDESDRERFTGKMKRVEEKAEKEGVKVQWYVGRMFLDDGKLPYAVRGLHVGGGRTIWLRADMDADIEAIADHELFHEAEEKDPTLVERIRENIAKEAGGAERLHAMFMKYADRFDGLSEDEIYSEIFADAFGGIDIFAGTSDRKNEKQVQNVRAPQFQQVVRSAMAESRPGAERIAENAEVKASREKREEVPDSIEKTLQKNSATVVDGVVVNDSIAPIMASPEYHQPVSVSDLADMASHDTMPAWAQKYINGGGDAETLQAIQQFDDMIWKDMGGGFTDVQKLLQALVPSGTVITDKYGPLRTNVEYRRSFDMDTSCPRTFQFTAYRNAIMKRLNRTLTFEESINLINLMAAYHQMIPCTYCYVENKRILKAAYYNNFYKFHNDVLNGIKNNLAIEDLRPLMYGWNAEKGKLTDAAEKTLKVWMDDKSGYNPTIAENYHTVNLIRNAAMHLLDGMVADGKITANTSVNSLTNIIAKEYGLKSKGALTEAKKMAVDWRYDAGRNAEHMYLVQDTGEEFDKKIADRALELDNEAINYSNAASSAKTVDNYAPYGGELENISKEDRDYIMGMGGIRKHSSNDFRIDYVLDYFQFYADLAKGKWRGHTYTKNGDYVRIFGRTGDMINMSIAFNDTADGVTENVSEGMEHKLAKELREAFPNAGVMAMVTSDKQLSYALNADWVDMIIPFHNSGLPKAIWYNMKAWADYTSVQSETLYNADDMKAALQSRGVDTKGMSAEEVSNTFYETFGVEKAVDTKTGKQFAPHFYPYETTQHGVKIPGHNNSKAKYMELCKQYGVHPRFDGVQVQNADGNTINVVDHPNYMKLIKETSRATENFDQPTVEFNFNKADPYLTEKYGKEYGKKSVTPMDYAMARLNEEAKNGGYQNAANDPMGIVDEFIRDYAGKGREIGWLSERAEMTKDALDNAQDKLVDETRKQTLEEFKKTEGEKPKPRERSNFYANMASREVDVDADTEESYNKAKQAALDFQSKYSGGVGAGKGIRLSNPEKDAISHALKSGNANLDDDGMAGTVSAYDRVYDFDVIDNEVVITGRMKSNSYKKTQEVYNGRTNRGTSGETAQSAQGVLPDGTQYNSESGRGYGQLNENAGMAGAEPESDDRRVLPDVADAPLGTIRLNKLTRTEYVDPFLYDEWVREHPDWQSGQRNAYSLEDVPAIIPTSGWERGATFEEVKAAHPTLFALAADEAEVRNPTQITGTVKTYRKIYDILKAEGFKGKILDASSGLGVGTEAGRSEYGFDVDDIEPFPDAKYKPKYTDYSKLKNQYDAIISNAVLNVIPQDLRDAMVVKIGQLLAPGGKAFINVRGTDVKNASSKVAINEDGMEYFISDSGSYQKGFRKAELVSYLKDALGDRFTVEPTNQFGGVAAIVTKDGGQNMASRETDIGDSKIYNRTVVLKEDTVDKYLKDYASKGTPKYAQAYIAYMSPDAFLKLTTTPAGRGQVSRETGPLDLENLKSATVEQPFQLRIDHESGDVLGHEGRHRATALYRANIDKIPVLLFDSSNKYSKAPIESLKLTGQFDDRATSTVTDVEPLSYGNRDAVVQKFATQPVLERLLEKHNERETVRYSRETDTRLEQQNIDLQKRLDAALGETKLTTAWRAAAKDVDRVTTDIIDATGSKESKAIVAQKIRSLVEAASNGGITAAEMKDLALDIARGLLKRSSVLTSPDSTTYDGMRKYLKSIYINVPMEMRKQMPDWKAFAAAHKAMRMKTSGVDVSTVYDELRQRLGEDYFPKLTDDMDKLQQIAEILDNLTPIFDNPYSVNMAEATEETANGILEAILDIGQAEPTYADRAKAREEGVRSLYQEKLAEQKESLQQRIQEEADKRKEQIEALKQTYREMNEKKRMRKQDSADRQKLLRVAKRLQNRKMDAVNRAIVDQLIGDLDTVSVHLTNKTLTNLRELADWYDSYKDDPNFLTVPQVEEKLKRLEKRHIGDMTIDEVRDLTDVLRSIEVALANYGKMIRTEDRRLISEMSTESQENIRGTKGSKKGIRNWLATNTLAPERLARRLTGYNDTDSLYMRMKELSDGQRKMFDYQMRAEALFSKWTNDKKFIDRIRNKETVKIRGFVDGKETTLEITPDMRMALYLHSLNDQNLKHIMNGGITIPDIDLYRKGDIQEAYARGVTAKLSPDMVRGIANGMTAEERAFAEAARKYFNGMSKDEINAVSEALLGYSIAGVENYFPIQTDDAFTQKEIDAIQNDGSIQGMGFTKERQNASNAIYLVPMIDVLNRSIQNHSKYVGMAIPVANMNKLWKANTVDGETDTTHGLKDAVRSKWGAEAKEAIDKILTDVQNPMHKSDALSKALAKVRSNYAGAVLSFNGSVALKQAASYPTAAAVLGWGPVTKAMGNVGKVDLDLIAKYTPLQWYRGKGYSTQELGDIHSRGGIMDKVMSAHITTKDGREVPLLNWIQGIDLMTTRKLWKASEYYVQENQPNLKRGSDDYYKAVADIYNRVIEETQPNYTTMQRPQILRTDNQLAQALVMFKTQPFQNFNILYDAIGELRAAEQLAKNGDSSKLAQAKKNAFNAVTSNLVSAVVFAAMTMAWNLFRRKKDKYEDEEGNFSPWGQLGKDILSSEFGMLPFGTDVYDLIAALAFDQKYYGMSNITSDSISGALESTYNACKALSDAMSAALDGNPETQVDPEKMARKLFSTAQDASKLLGIPLDNVVNLMTAVYSNVASGIDGEYVTAFNILKLTKGFASSATKNTVYDMLYQAYTAGDESYNDLLQAMLDSGDFKESAVKTAMETRMKNSKTLTITVGDGAHWMSPSQQKVYDGIMDNLSTTTAYKRANDEQIEALESAMRMYAVGSATGLKTAEKIEGGAKVGLDESEYFQYLLALKVVDQPNSNGKYGGNPTTSETENAIRMISGLTDAERNYLWGLTQPSDNSNPWATDAKTKPADTKTETKSETKTTENEKKGTEKKEEKPKKETLNIEGSSAISAAAYDPETKTAYITWKSSGKTYTYEGISATDWEAFKSAKSKGNYVNTNWK